MLLFHTLHTLRYNQLQARYGQFAVPIVWKSTGREIDISGYWNEMERDARISWPNAAPVRNVRGIEREHASNQERVCSRDAELEAISRPFLSSFQQTHHVMFVDAWDVRELSTLLLPFRCCLRMPGGR